MKESQKDIFEQMQAKLADTLDENRRYRSLLEGSYIICLASLVSGIVIGMMLMNIIGS